MLSPNMSLRRRRPLRLDEALTGVGGRITIKEVKGDELVRRFQGFTEVSHDQSAWVL
jgi:hypothetical protein